MNSLARAAALLTAAVGLLLLPTTAASASCATESGPQGSAVVFAGTAAEERRGFTRFEVDEVWAGPDLAPEVWVRSGQEQLPWPFYVFQGVASSVDAEFTPGESYAVGAGESFSTSDCNVSVVDESADLRPPDVRRPVAGGATGADPPAGLWATGAGFATLLLAPIVAFVAWRRLSRGARRPPTTRAPATPAGS